MVDYHKLKCCPQCGSTRITKTVNVLVNEPSTIRSEACAPIFCPECKAYTNESELPYLDDYIESIVGKDFVVGDDWMKIWLDENGNMCYVVEDDLARKIFKSDCEQLFWVDDECETQEIKTEEELEEKITSKEMIVFYVVQEWIPDSTRTRYVIPAIAEQIYRAFL